MFMCPFLMRVLNACCHGCSMAKNDVEDDGAVAIAEALLDNDVLSDLV